ncbi:hypothetical protein D3C77_470760 [compost metagenome]
MQGRCGGISPFAASHARVEQGRVGFALGLQRAEQPDRAFAQQGVVDGDQVRTRGAGAAFDLDPLEVFEHVVELAQETLLHRRIGQQVDQVFPLVKCPVDAIVRTLVQLGQQVVLDDVDGRERDAPVVDRLEQHEGVGMAAHLDLDQHGRFELFQQRQYAVLAQPFQSLAEITVGACNAAVAEIAQTLRCFHLLGEQIAQHLLEISLVLCLLTGFQTPLARGADEDATFQVVQLHQQTAIRIRNGIQLVVERTEQQADRSEPLLAVDQLQSATGHAVLLGVHADDGAQKVPTGRLLQVIE